MIYDYLLHTSNLLTRNNRVLDRRTVLRSVGVAFGATAGGAGVAAASDYQYGDHVEVVEEAWLYEYACPYENRLRLLDVGTTAVVYDTCTASDGSEWVFISLRDGGTEGWVREERIDHRW